MYINKYNIYNSFFNIIVIKERDSILKEINDVSLKIWNSRLYLTNKINNKKNQPILKNKQENNLTKNIYIINDKLDQFENNKIFITSFLKSLWEYPELVYEIIKNAEPYIVEDYFAPFFVNNFYINYASANYIENNLLYVITLLIKNEFDKKGKNIIFEELESYLDNSNLGLILDALGEIPDIQYFFNNLIVASVEKMERSSIIEEEINEDVDDLSTSTKSSEKKGKKNIYKKNYIDEFNKSVHNVKRRNKNYQKFVEKYSLDLKLSDISEKKEIAKKEQKHDLVLFLTRLEGEINKSKNANLFSNKILMSNFLKSNSPTYTLSYYQNEFLKAIDFIEQLLSDFEINVNLMPKILKSICTIISLIIKNKYKNITKIEEISLMSKFLIDILLIRFLSSPNYNAFIHQFIISESTIKGIQKITIVLKKLFSGKLFKNKQEECNFTPYNWLILEKYEEILSIMENSKKAELPTFIQNLIENKLNNGYMYDYFEENKGKLFIKISVCFSLDIILALIDSVKKIENFWGENEKNDKKIRLKRILDKLDYKNNRNKLKKVNEDRIENYLKEMKDKKAKINKNNIKNYYILNIQIIEKKYEKLFSLNNKMNFFYMDIKDQGQTQLTENDINLINLKNSICGVLSLYRPLDISDYSLNHTSTFKEIFSELKKYINLPNFTLNNNNGINLCNWYITPLFDYLDKIPEEYKSDNFSKLINELEQNIKDSIEALNFETINLMKNNLTFFKKALNYYEEKGRDIKDLILNENIKIVTEGIAILVDFKFKYDEEEQYFYLSKSTAKNSHFDGNIKFNKKNNCFTLKTVETLANFFPNIAEYNFSMDISPLQIIKDLSINKKLKEYFDMIKAKLTSNLPIESTQYNDLYHEKITNYVMNKIYDKIYPPIPDSLDSKITHNIKKIPKAEIDNLVKKEYNLQNLIPEMTTLFQKVYYARTPLNKLKCLINILDYITKIISLKKGSKNDSIGADDIVPLLNYFFVYAKPYKINSDIEFIKTFKCILPPCENDLVMFESIISKIINYSENKE